VRFPYASHEKAGKLYYLRNLKFCSSIDKLLEEIVQCHLYDMNKYIHQLLI